MKHNPLQMTPTQHPPCERCACPDQAAHIYKRRGVEYAAVVCPRCSQYANLLRADVVTTEEALRASVVLQKLGRQVTT